MTAVFLASAVFAVDFDAEWNFGDPASSEAKFRSLREAVKSEKDLNQELELETQIARALGLQKKFAAGHSILDGVQKRSNRKTARARIRLELERGRIFNSDGKRAVALPHFRTAFRLALKAPAEELAIDAAHMAAIAETRPREQLAWNLKAIGLAEKSTEEKSRKWLGSLYHNVGWAYHDSGKQTEALELFLKALTLREREGEANNLRLANWAVARAYRSLSRFEDAYAIQKKLEQEYDGLKQQDGFVYEELAELGIALNRADESKKYFIKAYDALIKDEWFVKNEKKRMKRVKLMAGIQ